MPPKKRYEKKRPNQQWHIDFAETYLKDDTRVVIIVLTDDYSRYCLRCEVVPDMTAETAINTVQAAWQEFGLPDEIVSDNGRASPVCTKMSRPPSANCYVARASSTA